MASAGGRWWHHFPGDGVPGGDHDECPVPGADREGPGVSLLENAQHVGHRLAVSRVHIAGCILHSRVALSLRRGRPEGGVGTAIAAVTKRLSPDFIKEIEQRMKRESSALFVLDYQGDLDAILHAIRGLGGTVLRTNVDLERAKLIQCTLAASAAEIE